MKPVMHEGEEMPIDHLEQMTITCPCEVLDRKLVIEVSFANHCYTEKYVEGAHEVEQIILTEAEDRHRIFCPIRYELSKQLPELIKELPSKRVHQTSQQRNYVYVVPLEVQGRPYEIYLMLQRASSDSNADLRLTIESAYLNQGASNTRRRPNSIRFIILAQKVFFKQTVRFAPR